MTREKLILLNRLKQEIDDYDKSLKPLDWLLSDSVVPMPLTMPVDVDGSGNTIDIYIPYSISKTVCKIVKEEIERLRDANLKTFENL